MGTETFSAFEPASEFTYRLRLLQRSGAMLGGRRIWCHAIDLPLVEIAHFFYPNGSHAGESRFDAPIIVFRSGGACSSPCGAGHSTFSELMLFPNGLRPACAYAGGVHEFVLLYKRETSLVKAAIRLPATFIEKVWQLILLLRSSGDMNIASALIEQFIADTLAFASARRAALADRTLQYLERKCLNVRRSWHLAQRLDVSEAHLCREFKAAFGCSIGKYVRIARVNLAAGLLWGTSLPIAEVACVCGYSDQAHLTRELDCLFAQTPYAFRRLAPCRGNTRLAADVHLLDAEFARSR